MFEQITSAQTTFSGTYNVFKIYMILMIWSAKSRRTIIAKEAFQKYAYQIHT